MNIILPAPKDKYSFTPHDMIEKPFFIEAPS
jgi:hypothetical protein